MRAVLTALIVFSLAGTAFAQSQDQKTKSQSPTAQQPQNNPSNLETKPGEAPASSPQGETPGGMQSAPKGSGKPNSENKK